MWIPPTAEINFCRAFALWVYSTPFSKMSTGFGSWELGLKIWDCVLRWLAVVSDCTGHRVENDIQCARYRRCTHGNHLCPPHVHHTPVTVRAVYFMCGMCSKKQKLQWLLRNRNWILPMNYTPSSHSTRSGIIAITYLAQLDRHVSEAGYTFCNSFILSFIHSFMHYARPVRGLNVTTNFRKGLMGVVIDLRLAFCFVLFIIF